MISDGEWDSVFGLGFGRLQGGFSADVVDTFQSISDDRVWIVAFGKKIAHFVGFGREIGVVCNVYSESPLNMDTWILQTLFCPFKFGIWIPLHDLNV